MMISDVILQANSEHEIFFLLTAYVESLRYCDKLGTLPAELTQLPLSGMRDLQGRLQTLMAELEKRSDSATQRRNAILREAADILGAALDRLQWLARHSIAAFRPDALVPTNAA